MTERLPVAVDAMGGDDAPSVMVEGALMAHRNFGVPVVLVGDPGRLGDTGPLEVLPASEVIPMGAEPATMVRRMKDASVVRAAEAVRDGRASALLSAGNTGAAMAASLLRMGRIKGVARPAIAVPFPVVASTPTMVLDCGANADSQPEWLVQFAMMGAVYVRESYGVATPRVGILTIGEEAGKGNSLVKAACALLEDGEWAKRCGADYIGNVEGRDLLIGTADVVVTDGFTGNVVLKSLEGGYAVFEDSVRATLAAVAPEIAPAEVIDRIVSSALNPMFAGFDPVLTGAALMLGTRGVALISHGSSTAVAISNAIVTADGLVDIDIVSSLRQTLTSSS
ncbi:MAG: phosphate acyltransferase PlsX [Actinomycetia bacterium]|nr:phosphate acyltransferase PlsX [Actinomycetes bacterium]MCP4223686.1 phosphate acyltransferase PlsX [Actinomycetes bacterium]MCP5031981.1 phosphate acyltransferase PlsX [Actinomycetes bacterium]